MALTRITKGVIKPNENYDTHNIVSTGIVTSVGLDVNGNADVSGSLSVGGVLTYEDVTSIDSIGIITARSGIDADDFISVGSNIHLGNAGVITATSFVGDGSGLIGVASTDNIVTGTAATFNTYPVDINAGMTIAGVTTFSDDVVVNFGTGNDLQIYHTSSTNRSYIKEVGSGGFYLQAANLNVMNPAGNETMLRAIPDGAVELYHNNIKHFETTSIGCKIYDDDTTAALEFQNSAGLAGLIMGESTNIIGFKDTNPHWLVKCIKDGAVELYHDNSLKLATASNGIDVTGMCTDDGARHDGDVYFIGATSGRNAVWDMSDDAFEFADNAKAKFGSSDDLQIYHDSTDSLIDFTNTAHNLRIRGDGEIRLEARYNELSLRAVKNGAVELYYDASAHSDAKLLTSEKGIKVGTGVTVETNGQATYVGIVTASAFKLSDGSNVGGTDSDAQNNTIGGTNAGDSFNGTNANHNTLFGYDAGTGITSGDYNTAIGSEALDNGTQTADAVAIGYRANKNSTTGMRNTVVGSQAMLNATDAAYNVAIGYQAGRDLASSSHNVAVGYEAGYDTASGGNTTIGSQAGKNLTSGGSNIIIGYNAQASTTTTSNEVTIGNASINHLRVPGIGVSFSEGGAVISGVCTATSFAGDGSALTGLSGVSVANQADNRLITATGTTDALNGEANLTFDGSTLTADGDVLFKSTTSGREVLWDKSLNRMIHRTNARASFGSSSQLEMWHNGSSVGYIMQGADGYLRIDGNDGLHFYTKPSGGSTTERLRIDSNGNVGINETSPQQQLHVHDDSDYQGILINGNSAPRIAFARTTTTTGEWSVGVDGTNGAQFVINNSNDNSNRKLIISSSEVSIANNAVVGGNLTASGYIDSSSDIKLKTNIKTIDNALDKVLQLRGAEYDRIDRDNEHEIGVIAQEVEKIIPEVVHGDETKTVSYGNLVGLLIEAVKDLKKEIDELKSS